MDCDVLIVGSGLAGLSAAYAASRAGASVLVLRKSGGSNSLLSQGGIACALNDEDAERHAADTVAAGEGLCDEKAVAVLVKEGRERIRDIIGLGMQFDERRGREAAHSVSRVLHAGGDETGKKIVEFFSRLLAGEKDVELMEAEAEALVVGRGGNGSNGCCGAVADGETINARGIILATGGYAALYERTTNAPEATGGATALCHRAGVALADLEFVQFHPTVFQGNATFLVSEAVRGEGGMLRNDGGERFVDELLQRDVVARAIDGQMRKGRRVFIDASRVDDFDERFPYIYRRLREQRIDAFSDLIPVAPAAHYCMGGTVTDTNSRTSLAGLYAAGECACSGVHGANRLASNSLLECLVFGWRAGSNAAKEKGRKAGGGAIAAEATPKADMGKIKKIMWENAGIMRNARQLRKALLEMKKMRGDSAALAGMVADAALARRESRGGHYRSDFPKKSGAWKKRRIAWK
ncbi:L-aspartate oxidase [Candidatus Micrarchaeota archaeon CG10_big_fil_rev_8_21_14_0_10_59_7]|nr:MAG: L-aspartate oxidase [Candidatus Micrarchaeota archaeon CG10_big_fil_rev_8_21_14_0_10_59_7]